MSTIRANSFKKHDSISCSTESYYSIWNNLNLITMQQSEKRFFENKRSVLQMYSQHAATTVSWSDVIWKEGMVGFAVGDISAV